MYTLCLSVKYLFIQIFFINLKKFSGSRFPEKLIQKILFILLKNRLQFPTHRHLGLSISRFKKVNPYLIFYTRIWRIISTMNKSLREKKAIEYLFWVPG